MVSLDEINMEKLYLFNVYTFCKSLYVFTVGSPYGFPWDPIYILCLYDQMWLVVNACNACNTHAARANPCNTCNTHASRANACNS